MKIKNAELQLLAKDAVFHKCLGERLIADENGGSLMFSFAPYISLVIWESARYLSANLQDQNNLLKSIFEKQIQASRHRMKLFDNPDELIQCIIWAREYHRELFIDTHTGILAPLKRAIQPDLGIYTYNKEYYGSSLLALVNLGFDIDLFPTVAEFKSSETSKLFFDFGLFIGEYFSELISIMGFSQFKYNFKLDMPCAALFHYVDKKANPFFENSFNGNKEADLNSVLFILYLSISFLVNVFDKFIISNPEPYLKIKYITLYHIVESLKKVQNIYRPKSKLSQLSINYLAEILSDQEIKSLTKNKSFRNTIVHYGIDANLHGQLNSQLPYYGLIEYYFSGMSFQEFNDLVDRQLRRVYKIMNGWLSGRKNA
ncbi:MAG: hypothetical protein ACTSQ8_24695 [Candidatus Helarchaeota archaeon]